MSNEPSIEEKVARAICEQWAAGSWDDQGSDKIAMWKGFARAALDALQEEPDVVRDHPAPRLRGRCIGCLSTDWPICRGCGADLSGEKCLNSDFEVKSRTCRVVGAEVRDMGTEELMEAQADLQTALGFYRLEHGRGDKTEDRLVKALARLHTLLADLGTEMFDPCTHPDVRAPDISPEHQALIDANASNGVPK